MDITKKLIMTFKSSDDKKVSISVDNPREDLTENEIKEAMDTIIDKNIFSPNGGSLVSAVSIDMSPSLEILFAATSNLLAIPLKAIFIFVTVLCFVFPSISFLYFIKIFIFLLTLFIFFLYVLYFIN